MQTRTSLFGLSAAAAILGLSTLVACSGSAPSGGIDEAQIVGDGGKKTETSSGAGTGGSSGTTPAPKTDAGTTPTGGGGACSDKASGDACLQCCAKDKEPEAFQSWLIKWSTCQCFAPGVCAEQCAASFCIGVQPAPNDACSKCLDQDTKCITQTDTACKGDDCEPFSKCMADSKCYDKK